MYYALFAILFKFSVIFKRGKYFSLNKSDFHNLFVLFLILEGRGFVFGVDIPK